MTIASPYGNPNWFRRQSRLTSPRQARQPDMNDPAQVAQSLYGAGVQIGEDGSPRATRDFGALLRLNSSQMNSLSKGAKPGSFSSLGQPMNSMYANNPGFFNRPGGSDFRQQIQQRNQSMASGAATPASPLPSYLKRPSQALDPDTPGGASAAARSKMMQPRSLLGALSKGATGRLDRFHVGGDLKDSPTSKDFFKEGDPNAPKSIALSSRSGGDQGTDDRATGLRLLREMSQTPLQITSVDGGKNLVGKYGTGSATFGASGGTRKEGTVNGVGFAEMMQGLANKQVREGTWRKGDRLPDAGTQKAKAYDKNTRSGLLTEDQALAESEKARQNSQSNQRLNKR